MKDDRPFVCARCETSPVIVTDATGYTIYCGLCASLVLYDRDRGNLIRRWNADQVAYAHRQAQR